MSQPLTCPNGHAMDEGYFNCPACGAYRPSATDPDASVMIDLPAGMAERAVEVCEILEVRDATVTP